MSHLFLMMGQPGCGKSTFIKKHKDQMAGTTVVISRDAIRFSMVKETEEYFSKEKEVFKELIYQIQTALTKFDNVIVDATHLNQASRSKILKNIKNTTYETANIIWIKTPLDIALKQNALRAGTRAFVPPSALCRMFYQIQPPEFQEGFTTIYEVENNHVSVRKEL